MLVQGLLDREIETAMTTWLLPLAALVVGAIVFWWLWPGPLARLFMLLERRRGRLRRRRVTVAGIDWHLLEGGHGEPLVLLHGFNGDAYHFTRIARFLDGHFRIIALDLPGFGQTRFEGELDYRIERQAERVLALLDEIGIRNFYLGGSSMGGYVAAALAHRVPERVCALWLLAPGGLQTAPLSPLFQVVFEGGHNALVARNRQEFGRLMDYCFVRPPWIPGPLARVLADRAARHAVRAQRIFDSIRFESTPLEELADGLDVPTLVVWGQVDQVLHPDGLDILAGRLPNHQTLLLPETGHLPMLERPREVAEAWLAFASRAALQTRRTLPAE